MTRMILAASSASGSWQYLLANTKQASASWTCRVRKKLLILDPTRGKLYTAKQDSAELFGQRATYILSLSDSLHYHFMSFLLKGFLQILSSLARKSRKNLFNLFCVHYSFMSWQSWKARVAENYGQKVLQKTFFSCAQCAISFRFTQKMKGKHAKTYKHS